ncbi:MAG: DUF192 domain-containing protein [Spirochaetales bacterium]|nr:DUF192 domain-containing protein [Spirochaetales bacterium]
MNKQIFIFASVIIILLTGCSKKEELITITVGNNIYHIEAARTREEQSRGLMYRESLKSDEGMIFIYEEDRKLSFWMKNTYVPLSVAFIAKDGTIKEIHQLKPESLTPVKSTHSVRYALELPSGSFKRSGASVGDKITIPPLITDK